MDYVVVSFATLDGKYNVYGCNFEKNMSDINIQYNVVYRPPVDTCKTGKFLFEKMRKKKDQTRRKSQFLLKMFDCYDCPIVWVDVDDGFISKPKIPNIAFDVGFIRNDTEAGKRLPIISALMIFNHTDNAKHFLKVWNYLNSWPELEPYGGDHIRLWHAKNICEGKEAKNPLHFKSVDMSDYFLPHFRLNLNRKRKQNV